MATITLANFAASLKQSTQPRGSSPDGNIYFDRLTARIQVITVEELATVDFGSGPVPNPISNQDGIKLEALYPFERQERRLDETLRRFEESAKGTFKFAGAYETINGWQIDAADRQKIRGSGWIERDDSAAIGRIYFGPLSLGNIEATSQPYYQLVDGGVPTDFAKPGPVDEPIQVFGDAAVDAATTTFDTRLFLSLKVRTYGFIHDEKQLGDSGLSEMDGYSAGFGLTESPHPTTGNFAEADVFGGAAIAPWTGLSLEQLDTPVVESGFAGTDGSFSWVVRNPNNATLDQVVAWLDAIAASDTDINDHASNTTFGKRVSTWYTFDAAGKVVTRSGADADGLFIENLPTADEQRVIFTDDAGDSKVRPFLVSVVIDVGPNALADPNAWYQVYFTDGPGVDDYNTDDAITVLDASGAEVKGVVQTDQVGGRVTFAFDYDNDALGGPAGTDKDITIEVEGDGIATFARTQRLIERQTVVPATCAPGLETNI